MKKIFCMLIMLMAFSPRGFALDISAEAGIVIAADTNEIIYAKNEGVRLPMASTTKIMTAIVALEKTKPDDVVTVSANAANQEGSSIYLRCGDKIRMEDLLYGLMLNSGNDAAVAVAEYVSGSVDGFSGEMNKLAEKIGAEDSSFKNPNGLDDAEHYTTAYDLAKITSYAMQNEDFKRIVSTRETNAEINNAEVLYFSNHNKLLKMYDGAVGVKTGFTKRSGRCLVSAANRDGITLIAVTLNAPDDWNDHMEMLDYGFSKCEKREIITAGQNVKMLNTPDGAQVGAVVEDSVSIPAVDGKIPECEVRLYLAEELLAPIYSGEKIGEAEILCKGKLLKTVDILSDRDVQKAKPNFRDVIARVVENWINAYLQIG